MGEISTIFIVEDNAGHDGSDPDSYYVHALRAMQSGAI